LALPDAVFVHVFFFGAMYMWKEQGQERGIAIDPTVIGETSASSPKKRTHINHTKPPFVNLEFKF